MSGKVVSHQSVEGGDLQKLLGLLKPHTVPSGDVVLWVSRQKLTGYEKQLVALPVPDGFKESASPREEQERKKKKKRTFSDV